MFMNIKWMWLTGLTIFLAFVPAAVSQIPGRQDNWKQCTGIDPDLSIGGCTALIQSGQVSKNDLAPVFNRRGIAYARKGELDKAIADFTDAIHLEPDYAAAFNSRGTIYYYKGDYDKAIADYSAA